jgi:hypothetical protein
MSDIVRQTEQMRAQGVHHTILQAEKLQEAGVNQQVCDIVLDGGSIAAVIQLAQSHDLQYHHACIQMSSVCLMEALARHQKMDMEQMTQLAVDSQEALRARGRILPVDYLGEGFAPPADSASTESGEGVILDAHTGKPEMEELWPSKARESHRLGEEAMLLAKASIQLLAAQTLPEQQVR